MLPELVWWDEKCINLESAYFEEQLSSTLFWIFGFFFTFLKIKKKNKLHLSNLYNENDINKRVQVKSNPY